MRGFHPERFFTDDERALVSRAAVSRIASREKPPRPRREIFLQLLRRSARRGDAGRNVRGGSRKLMESRGHLGGWVQQVGPVHRPVNMFDESRSQALVGREARKGGVRLSQRGAVLVFPSGEQRFVVLLQ